MKVLVHGPRAGYGPDGMLHSWAPDQAVEVDDGDKKAVAWARMFVTTGAATLVEDAPEAPRRGPGRPSKASLAAAAELAAAEAPAE
jgi:hypothetical protein